MLDDGSDLGIIVHDIDYIPFFTPNYKSISDTLNDEEDGGDGTLIQQIENETKDVAKGIKKAIESTNDEGVVTKEAEETKNEEKEEEKAAPVVTISGMQMLTEIKRIAKEAEEHGHALPDENLKALKVSVLLPFFFLEVYIYIYDDDTLSCTLDLKKF